MSRWFSWGILGPIKREETQRLTLEHFENAVVDVFPSVPSHASRERGIDAAGQTVDEWQCMGGCANWWVAHGIQAASCPSCGWRKTYPTGASTHIRGVDIEVRVLTEYGFQEQGR